MVGSVRIDADFAVPSWSGRNDYNDTNCERRAEFAVPS